MKKTEFGIALSWLLERCSAEKIKLLIDLWPTLTVSESYKVATEIGGNGYYNVILTLMNKCYNTEPEPSSLADMLFAEKTTEEIAAEFVKALDQTREAFINYQKSIKQITEKR